MLISVLYVVYVLLPVLDVDQFVVCGLCFTSSTGCFEQFVVCGLCFHSSTGCFLYMVYVLFPVLDVE